MRHTPFPNQVNPNANDTVMSDHLIALVHESENRRRAVAGGIKPGRFSSWLHQINSLFSVPGTRPKRTPSVRGHRGLHA